MRRRDFLLKSVAVTGVVPYVDALPADVKGIDEPRLTYSNKNNQTDRVLERYELKPNDKLRVQWRLRDANGHVNFREEYPFDQLSEYYRENAVVIRFYTPPPNRELLGHTYLSTEDEYVYHNHVQGDTAPLYSEHIETGDYTRIQ